MTRAADTLAMLAMPSTLEAMIAHLTAPLPNGHAKAAPTDGQSNTSLAKYVDLHDSMHGASGVPYSHQHPTPSESDMQGASDTLASLPQNGLVRAAGAESYELREPPGGSTAAPTMFGHFARFDDWTEIDSNFEGHFMERIAPGAFARTFAEDRASMKVTYNHGKSPLGDQVLGPIDELREDDQGAYYEVPLFPNVPPLLLDGLRAGVYGASFRFRVTREDFNKQPKRSDTNPEGLPERTIVEARVGEFGPVTFPAYASATAGVRSLTDEFLTESQLEEFRALATDLRRKPDEAAEKTGTTPPAAGKAKRRSNRTIDYLKEREPSWKL